MIAGRCPEKSTKVLLPGAVDLAIGGVTVRAQVMVVPSELAVPVAIVGVVLQVLEV